MSNLIAVCRRVEDHPEVESDWPYPPITKDVCAKCQKEVFVEDGVEGEKQCIYCAPDNSILFVDMPPDEYGGRSISVSVKEVREQDNGEWHKTGLWHDQQWALKHAQ